MKYIGAGFIIKIDGRGKSDYGEEAESEATRYSKSADLRRTVEGTEKFQFSERVPTQERNPIKKV